MIYVLPEHIDFLENEFDDLDLDVQVRLDALAIARAIRLQKEHNAHRGE